MNGVAAVTTFKLRICCLGFAAAAECLCLMVAANWRMYSQNWKSSQGNIIVMLSSSSLPSWTDGWGRGAQLASKRGCSGEWCASITSSATRLGSQSAVVAVQTLSWHITGRSTWWLARLTTSGTTVGTRARSCFQGSYIRVSSHQPWQ